MAISFIAIGISFFLKDDLKKLEIDLKKEGKALNDSFEDEKEELNSGK